MDIDGVARSPEQTVDVAASPEVTAVVAYLPEEFIFPRYYYYTVGGGEGLTAAGTRPDRDETRLRELVSLVVYLSPAFLLFSTIGNLLGAVTLYRIYPAVLSTAFYVFVGLLLDTVVIWSRCGVEWLRLVAEKDLRGIITSSSIVLCKVYPFLSNLTLHFDSWLLVAMAAETVFVYQRPQRLMKVCRLRRSRLISAIILISLCLINSLCFWTYSHVTPFSDFQTTTTDDDDDDDSILPPPPGVVCANWIAQSFDPRQTGSGLDLRRIFVMIVDLVVADVGPFFVIFSCCVMLVTKRVKRRDQVRQIDNTWKACNVDSSAAHQLHTCFVVLCILHTVLLFPKLTYKSFLFVTDLHVTGLAQKQGTQGVQGAVGHRTSAVVARAVCHLLHYVYLTTKVLVFFAASPSFRRECRRAPTSCLRPTKDRTAGPGPEDDAHPASGDHVTTGLPLLPPQTQTNDSSQLTADVKYDALTSTAILENGAPCIKIFSMTSV